MFSTKKCCSIQNTAVLIAIFLHFMATIPKSDANSSMEYKLRKLYQLFIVEKPDICTKMHSQVSLIGHELFLLSTSLLIAMGKIKAYTL